MTLKLFNRTEQTEKHIYDDSTQFRTLTMRILRSAFIGINARIYKYVRYWIGCIEATLNLVVFHNIDFKTAAIGLF